MLDDSIRGAEQVDARDAAHLRLHSSRRQVLLPQTWNQHSGHRVQGRSHIHVTQGTTTVRREEKNMWFRIQINKIIKYEAMLQENRSNRRDCWTTEHTHGVKTHQHNLCSLIRRQLESGNNHGSNITLIGLMNHFHTDHELIGRQWKILITSQTQIRIREINDWENKSLHSWFSPVKHMWWTDSSNSTKKWHGVGKWH